MTLTHDVTEWILDCARSAFTDVFLDVSLDVFLDIFEVAVVGVWNLAKGVLDHVDALAIAHSVHSCIADPAFRG
jgi:hypothetical protein